MKKLTLIAVASIWLLPNLILAQQIDLNWCKKQKFIVSGYYSPEKWQKFYHKWDYFKEIRLNWHWIRWASWKPVFNWMIAAPKKYPFGTKIYFPGYWVWVVEDRWSAIVEAWKRWYQYDRIDIWMWKGQNALIRAMSWGKKELVGYVCPPNKNLPIWFDWWNFPIYKGNFFDVSVFAIELTYWRKDNWVQAMQKYLTKLGYFPQEQTPTWFFWPITKKSLCQFQVDYWILKKNDPRCGIVRGPQTRWTAKQALISKWILKKNFYLSYIIPNKSKPQSHWAATKLSYNKAIFTKPFKKWEKSQQIALLQYYLSKLWFYNWPENGIYDSKTIEAVYAFQLKHWILDLNAPLKLRGYLWPSTRAKLNQIIQNSEKLVAKN